MRKINKEIDRREIQTKREKTESREKVEEKGIDWESLHRTLKTATHANHH